MASPERVPNERRNAARTGGRVRLPFAPRSGARAVSVHFSCVGKDTDFSAKFRRRRTAGIRAGGVALIRFLAKQSVWKRQHAIQMLRASGSHRKAAAAMQWLARCTCLRDAMACASVLCKPFESACKPVQARKQSNRLRKQLQATQSLAEALWKPLTLDSISSASNCNSISYASLLRLPATQLRLEAKASRIACSRFQTAPRSD